MRADDLLGLLLLHEAGGRVDVANSSVPAFSIPPLFIWFDFFFIAESLEWTTRMALKEGERVGNWCLTYEKSKPPQLRVKRRFLTPLLTRAKHAPGYAVLLSRIRKALPPSVSHENHP